MLQDEGSCIQLYLLELCLGKALCFVGILWWSVWGMMLTPQHWDTTSGGPGEGGRLSTVHHTPSSSWPFKSPVKLLSSWTEWPGEWLGVKRSFGITMGEGLKLESGSMWRKRSSPTHERGREPSADVPVTGDKGVNDTNSLVRRRREPKAPSPLPSMKLASINQSYSSAREIDPHGVRWDPSGWASGSRRGFASGMNRCPDPDLGPGGQVSPRMRWCQFSLTPEQWGGAGRRASLGFAI